jgi:hypothetical protein
MPDGERGVRGTWQRTVKYQQVCKSWSTSVEVLALWGTGGEFLVAHK